MPRESSEATPYPASVRTSVFLGVASELAFLGWVFLVDWPAPSPSPIFLGLIAIWVIVPFMFLALIGRFKRRSAIAGWIILGVAVVGGGGGFLVYLLSLFPPDIIVSPLFAIVPGLQLGVAAAATIAVIAVD